MKYTLLILFFVFNLYGEYENIDNILKQTKDITEFDILNWRSAGCLKNIRQIKPDFIYNLSDEMKIQNKSEEAVLDSLFTLINKRNSKKYSLIHFQKGKGSGESGEYIFKSQIRVPSYTILRGESVSYYDDKNSAVIAFPFNTEKLKKTWKRAENDCNILFKNTRFSGIENIKIKSIGIDDDYINNNFFHFSLVKSYKCWIKSVYSYNAVSGHAAVYKSGNIEIRDSYFIKSHYTGTGGNGYGISFQDRSVQCLAENNIFDDLRHAVIFSNESSYNVCGYNYSDRRVNDEAFEFLKADISFHGHSMDKKGRGPYKNLIEGNRVNFINFDVWWGGNGRGNVIFKNSIKDKIQIQNSAFNLHSYEYDDDNRPQIFYSNKTGDWDIWDNQVIHALNNKVDYMGKFVWENDYESSFKIKSFYKEIE